MVAKFFPASTNSRSGGTRSLPLFRTSGSVFGPSTPAAPIPAGPAQTSLPFVPSRDRSEMYGGIAAPMTVREQAEAALWVAQNAQIVARRDYVKARAAIGLANARGVPASKWHRADLFTPAQIRRRRSLAFSAFNRATAQLRAADRAVATAAAELATFNLAGGAA